MHPRGELEVLMLMEDSQSGIVKQTVPRRRGDDDIRLSRAGLDTALVNPYWLIGLENSVLECADARGAWRRWLGLLSTSSIFRFSL